MYPERPHDGRQHHDGDVETGNDEAVAGVRRQRSPERQQRQVQTRLGHARVRLEGHHEDQQGEHHQDRLAAEPGDDGGRGVKTVLVKKFRLRRITSFESILHRVKITARAPANTDQSVSGMR